MRVSRTTVRWCSGPAVLWGMDFRRINGLPPYVFATMNDLKAAARLFYPLQPRAPPPSFAPPRSLSPNTRTHTKKPSKTRQFLLIVTPTLLAVVAYIVLGRLLALSPRADASVGRLKPRHIARLFGIRFCLCFVA